MELLSEEQYLALSKKQQSKYMEYNPSLQDKAIGYLITLANNGIAGLNQISSFYETVKFMPDPTPAQQLETLLKPFTDMEEAFKVLEGITNVPGITQVVNVFKNLFKVVGFVIQMVLLMQRQISLYSDAMIKAFNNIDWERMKENLDSLTGDSKENTPGIEATMLELDTINFPTEKIKSDIKEIGDQVKLCANQIKNLLTIKDTYQPIVDSNKQFTWDYFLDKLNQATSLLGLDFDQLKQEVDQTKFQDPTADALEVTNKINNLMKNKQYILKTDMDILIKKRNEKEKNNA